MIFVVDAFWFLYVEDQLDREVAKKMNEKVWGKAAEMTRDIVKRFTITDKGLKGFVKALQYFPGSSSINYEIEEKEDEVVFRYRTAHRKKRGSNAASASTSAKMCTMKSSNGSLK